MTLSLHFNKDYKSLLEEFKTRIKAARVKVALSVNQELIKFYWEMGNLLIKRQSISNWGDKLFTVLANDLKNSFPDTQGFSRSNLHSMKKFAEAYPDFKIVQAMLGQLPWTHNLVLLERVESIKERKWYAKQVIKNGWSYRMLINEIKEQLYLRQANNNTKTTNFKSKLPSPHYELAQDIIKDPYKFHFLSMGDDVHERELQRALITHISQFLLALGQGFAFYATNYQLNISKKNYEIDLLMYHTKLHCYVVIELKRGEFHPKDSGQLNFYLSAIDRLLKTPKDNPSIGLLLCEKKDKIIAEYALQDVSKPIGISEYELSKALTKKIRGNLPTIAEIEAELSQDLKKLTKARKLSLKTKDVIMPN